MYKTHLSHWLLFYGENLIYGSWDTSNLTFIVLFIIFYMRLCDVIAHMTEWKTAKTSF